MNAGESVDHFSDADVWDGPPHGNHAHRSSRRFLSCRGRPWRRLLLVAGCGALLACQPGCLVLDQFIQGGRGERRALDVSHLEAQGYSMPPGGLPTSVTDDASSGPSIVLEVRNGDAPHLERIPLPIDRPVFVQDIVQQANLHKQIGRLQIAIMRPVGPGQPPLRMDVRTDGKGQTTSMGTNYALVSGDHLIVTKDDTGGLGELIMRFLQ
ncbi:MAG: hypothetical protein KatS3mg111_2875 [Pirellulaceae bacterium]|nr:MAG: hypothetical protein KatS3mg111_2875 [Pirellulaceae bacterium]